MKEYKVLLGLSAECVDDFHEIIECFQNEHACEVEWWTEVSETHQRFSKEEIRTKEELTDEEIAKIIREGREYLAKQDGGKDE